METSAPSNKLLIIKYLYFYVVSVVALFMVVFSVVDVINIGLRTFLFPKADQNAYGYYAPPCLTTTDASSTKDINCVSKDEQQRIDKENTAVQKQRDLVRDISMILVAVPLFAYHWRIIRKRDM